MSKFNDDDLKDYQPVKERLALLFKQFPDARVISEIIKAEKFETIFKASIYRDFRDLKESLPLSTGFSQEFQDAEDFINDACFFENAETSAIGRALRNAGIGDFNVSKEEMIKTKVHHPFKEPQNYSPKDYNQKSAYLSKKSLEKKNYSEKNYTQGIKVSGPKVASGFEFKKLRPKLSEEQILSYVVPSGVHKGLRLDQIGPAELSEYSNFLSNNPKQSEWVRTFLNVKNQYDQLNS